jgi:hypothetical protein
MALPVPDDALADILRRLPPRSLAAARCICKPWRDLVDGRALLLPRLLPHSVHGVLINYIDHDLPHLFSRRRIRSRSTSSPAASSGGGDIDGNLSTVPKGDMDWWWWHVMDHCDSLLLCAVEWGNRLCVCNPATLPPCPESPEPIRYGTGGAYLAFDPAAASPHYEVLLVPGLPEKPLPLPPPPPPPSPPAPPSSFMGGDDDLYRLMEWPPSPYKVDVFSSRSARWEERAFVREGGETAATTTMVDDMEPWECPLEGPRQGYRVFWQGALYVHSRGTSVTR